MLLALDSICCSKIGLERCEAQQRGTGLILYGTVFCWREAKHIRQAAMVHVLVAHCKDSNIATRISFLWTGNLKNGWWRKMRGWCQGACPDGQVGFARSPAETRGSSFTGTLHSHHFASCSEDEKVENDTVSTTEFFSYC